MNELHARLRSHVLAWGVRVGDVVDTPNSLLAFGHRQRQPVVLKIVKRLDDEWLSGLVLEAFGGCSVVRMLEHAGGAVLLERLLPGTSLADADIADDEKTAIIANVIGRMSPGPPPAGAPTAESLATAFERYAASSAVQIPGQLVDAARRTYAELCASQASPRLLHGDLHHHNVLLDAERGWLAIDPKGIVGELAYEVGAALRNPCERPEIFTSPAVIRQRVERYAAVLQLDDRRVLAWAFAQVVLAAIWELEDDGRLDAGLGWIALAESLRRLLSQSDV
jgi:streptomycin 6-kinase